MGSLDVTSGAKVVINVADFKSSMALKNAIASELSRGQFSLGSLDGDIEGFLEMDTSKLEPLLKGALLLDSSEKVNEALFKCLIRCTYNGAKITEETFEAEEARADYYEIVLECLKVNLMPFMKSLVSKFNSLSAVES